jgi:hypothetical protein
MMQEVNHVKPEFCSRKYGTLGYLCECIGLYDATQPLNITKKARPIPTLPLETHAPFPSLFYTEAPHFAEVFNPFFVCPF